MWDEAVWLFKQKTDKIAQFDSLQPLILTVNGLSAEEPRVASERHSCREYAPVRSRPTRPHSPSGETAGFHQVKAF